MGLFSIFLLVSLLAVVVGRDLLPRTQTYCVFFTKIQIKNFELSLCVNYIEQLSLLVTSTTKYVLKMNL